MSTVITDRELLETIIDKTDNMSSKEKQTSTVMAPIILLEAMSGVESEETLPAQENAIVQAETSTESIQSSKGLVALNKANLLDICNYVRRGMALPTDIPNVELKLGYKSGDTFSLEHPYFTPEKFVGLFAPIKAHARRWEPLKDSIISQGNNIEVYGRSFVSHADFILKYTNGDKMDFCKSIDETAVPSEQDRKLLIRLVTVLEEWVSETCTHKKTTEQVLSDLGSFKNTLTDEIKPNVNIMNDNLSKLDLNDEMRTLTKEIDDDNKEIDALQAAYSKTVGLAFTGAAGMAFPPIGIISWAITGGIYGAKAEKLRKKKEDLIEKRNKKQQKLKGLSAISEHVTTVSNDVHGLDSAITNAIVGLTNLNAVWDLINDFIGSAKENLENVDKKSDLFDFNRYVQSARDAWERVPGLASYILRLFNEAYLEANSSKI